MSQQEDKFEEEFPNWVKAVLGLQKARDGSIKYIKRKMEPFVDKLRRKHRSNQGEHFKELLTKVAVNGDVKKIHLHKKDPTKIGWVLDGNKCTTCDKIFEKQLDMFINRWCPCKEWISNSKTEQVEPSSYWWILAKMYIAKPEIIDAVGPEEVEPLAIFNLIKHCKLFDPNLQKVVDTLVQLRHRLMHSANNRLTGEEMVDSFDLIKEFLKHVAANPTETTDIINDVEMLEKKSLILFDVNGELCDPAKEALKQHDKSLNADFKAPEGISGVVIKSSAWSTIFIKQQEMKHDKRIKELMKENEDILRKYEELEKKVDQYEGKHDIGGELVGQKKRKHIHKIKSSRDININESNDTDVCISYGCCITPDNQLLVTDVNNKKVKRIDISTLSIVDSCLVDSLFPLGIYCINNIEAAVACSSPNKIQFVSFENKMKTTRKITTPHLCNSIAKKDDHLYASDYTTSIYVYDMNGTWLRTIINDNDGNKLFSEIRHIAFNGSGDKMFVSDNKKGLVCLDGKYNYLSTIKDNDLNGAVGVCTDGGENIFVTGYLSNNAVQFNEDGQQIGVVVKQKDGLKNPLSISFHQGHSRMYVTLDYSDIMKMYELE